MNLRRLNLTSGEPICVSASKTMLKAVNGMMGFLSAGEETNNVGGVNSERE